MRIGKYITDGLRWACRYTGMCILIHLRTICPFNTTLVYIIHYCKGLWLTVFYKEFGRGPSGYVWQPTKTTKGKKWCEKESQQKLNAYSSTHQKTTDQSKTLTTCKDLVFSWLRGKHILNNFSFHRSTNKNIKHNDKIAEVVLETHTPLPLPVV